VGPIARELVTGHSVLEQMVEAHLATADDLLRRRAQVAWRAAVALLGGLAAGMTLLVWNWQQGGTVGRGIVRLVTSSGFREVLVALLTGQGLPQILNAQQVIPELPANPLVAVFALFQALWSIVTSQLDSIVTVLAAFVVMGAGIVLIGYGVAMPTPYVFHTSLQASRRGARWVLAAGLLAGTLLALSFLTNTDQEAFSALSALLPGAPPAETSLSAWAWRWDTAVLGMVITAAAWLLTLADALWTHRWTWFVIIVLAMFATTQVPGLLFYVLLGAPLIYGLAAGRRRPRTDQSARWSEDVPGSQASAEPQSPVRTTASLTRQTTAAAPTDLYDEEQHTVVVQYPRILVIALLCFGLIAFALTGFLGLRPAAGQSFQPLQPWDTLFKEPWILFTWFCVLLLVLELSILRHPDLLGRRVAAVLATVVFAVLVSLRQMFPPSVEGTLGLILGARQVAIAGRLETAIVGLNRGPISAAGGVVLFALVGAWAGIGRRRNRFGGGDTPRQPDEYAESLPGPKLPSVPSPYEDQVGRPFQARWLVWLPLLLVSMFAAESTSQEVQVYLHVLSDQQTCSVPGYLACDYVNTYLSVGGTPYSNAAVAVFLAGIAVLAMSGSMAVLVSSGRVLVNTLRFAAYVGRMALTRYWMAALPLSGLDRLGWVLVNHQARLPFPQPEVFTVISIAAFVVSRLLALARRDRRSKVR
jgi:hypothetical protein